MSEPASHEAAPSRLRNRITIWRPSSSNMSETRFAHVLLLPLVIFLAAIIAFPFGYALWLSTQKIALGTGRWKFVGLDQYARALSDPMFWSSVKLAVIYAVAATIFTMALSIFGAVILNEKFPGRSVLVILTILPWALSQYATGILWKYIYSIQLGLINAVYGALHIGGEPINVLGPDAAIFGVALAHSWQLAPFGVYFLLAVMQVIPPDMYKVAKVDGVRRIGRFRHVTLPYLRGPALALAVLIVLAAVRVFDIIYLISNGGPSSQTTTLNFYIYMQTFRAFDIGYGSAMSTFLLIGILAVMSIYFIILTRQRRRKSP